MRRTLFVLATKKVVMMLVLVLLAMGSSAFASTLYSNGPVNGTSNAYFIDVYEVSDQFNPSGSTMNGFGFAEWVPAGDSPLTFNWSVGNTAFGTNLGSGTGVIGLNATATLLCSSGNPFNGGICGGGFGYDVYFITATTSNIAVGAGDWLSLTGATDNFGGRDAWDINYGPSAAEHSLLGPIPSESFDIYGPGGGVPEPASLMLLGTGLIGVASALRRKLFR